MNSLKQHIFIFLTFVVSSFQVWISWIFWSGPHKAIIKVMVGAVVSSEIHNTLPKSCGCWSNIPPYNGRNHGRVLLPNQQKSRWKWEIRRTGERQRESLLLSDSHLYIQCIELTWLGQTHQGNLSFDYRQ